MFSVFPVVHSPVLSAKLSVLAPVAGGGADRLRFASNGLNAGQLAQINFFSDAGVTQLSLTASFPANGFVSFGEVVPVPEPSSVATVLGLLGLVAWHERRKSSQARRESRKVSA